MELLEFLNKSVNEYYASKNICDILEKEHFKCLYLSEKWNLKNGMNYYVKIDETAVIAFKMGQKESTSDQLFHFQIMASHLDSPVLKIKPNGIINNKGHNLLNCEVYGGPILYSWFDKPLGIAGRIMVRENGEIKSQLVNTEKPVAIIASAPIHLKKENTFNPQKDLLPLIGINDTLDMLNLINKLFGIEKEKIISFDLNLYNKTDACYLGINNELIASPRLDNLESAYSTLMGFIKANPKSIAIYASFNNEEVGSNTKQGADSTILYDVLLKIAGSVDNLNMMLAKSFIASVDNAHAYHPNYPELYDPTNVCEMNKGIVIKHNANMRYTTDALSEAITIEIMNKANLKYQHYTNRSDIRGGSTLGAISSSHLSIPSVDIGLAQLAMHSNYETAGAKDFKDLIEFSKCFYNFNIIIDKEKIKVEV